MQSFHQYIQGRRDEASELPVGGRGAFWASHVLNSPPNGDEPAWKSLGVAVRTGPSDATYTVVVLGAIDNAAADPIVARDFLDYLADRADALSGRI
ncbi:MAG: hypothetical protein ACRDPW_03795, partial [Mycobacteriales bacterium]